MSFPVEAFTDPVARRTEVRSFAATADGPPAAPAATLLEMNSTTETLYVIFGEPAHEGEAPGRTVETRAKETVDNDVEALALDLLIDG